MATVYGTAQKVHTAITSSVQRVRSSVISSEVQRYIILSKCKYQMLLSKRKKRKIPRSCKASVTHGAPSSTHDAHTSNDAQASQTMQKTSKTMRKASSAMKKHPHDAQSITCNAQASARCPKHQVISLNKMTDRNYTQ